MGPLREIGIDSGLASGLDGRWQRQGRMKRMNGNPMLQLTGLRMLGHHRPLVTYANIGEQQNMLVQELERGERKKGTILHRHPSPTLSLHPWHWKKKG
ncbi:hypothetical protein ABG768_011559 [Culter alburnus]|uniref:Uncharacterized protein n=1 Tax=Culter alburnus TaxID=194366 RepID=A0AAW1ZAA2_CULAL